MLRTVLNSCFTNQSPKRRKGRHPHIQPRSGLNMSSVCGLSPSWRGYRRSQHVEAHGAGVLISVASSLEGPGVATTLQLSSEEQRLATADAPTVFNMMAGFHLDP